MDDLDGVDAAVRDVSDDTKANEVVSQNWRLLIGSGQGRIHRAAGFERYTRAPRAL